MGAEGFFGGAGFAFGFAAGRDGREPVPPVDGIDGREPGVVVGFFAAPALLAAGFVAGREGGGGGAGAAAAEEPLAVEGAESAAAGVPEAAVSAAEDSLPSRLRWW